MAPVSSSTSCQVEVDGQRFSVHLGGSEAPLGVDASTGQRVHLSQWRLEDHLRALDRCVFLEGDAVAFDPEALAWELLRGSNVPEALYEELSPIALWWALGGGPLEAVTWEQDGWVCVGAVRARLRPWTFAERARALSASLVTLPGGARELSLEGYLRAMLATCVLALEPADRPWVELVGADAAALLDAVVTLNAAGEREEDRLVLAEDAEGRAMAHTLLRLCGALGWTPSQVWATPAAEVQRLLALLDVAGAEAPRAAPAPQGLAAYPDAVVIHVEDP